MAEAAQTELNLSQGKTRELTQILMRPHKHKHRGVSKSKENKSGGSESKKKLQLKMDLDTMNTRDQQYPGNAKPEDLKAYKVCKIHG
jgi:hypothetical protein